MASLSRANGPGGRVFDCVTILLVKNGLTFKSKGLGNLTRLRHGFGIRI